MKRLLPSFLALALLAGCTSPGFVPVQHVTVHPRRAVDPDVVDGVLFYQGGGPNRPYRVLGYSDEFWLGPYLDETDLKRCAKTVRENGGKAGVVIRGGGPLPGNPPRHRREDDDFALRLQIIE
jgi:hypothetical protein